MSLGLIKIRIHREMISWLLLEFLYFLVEILCSA